MISILVLLIVVVVVVIGAAYHFRTVGTLEKKIVILERNYVGLQNKLLDKLEAEYERAKNAADAALAGAKNATAREVKVTSTAETEVKKIL